MVIQELKKTFEQRRSNLIAALENPDSRLELSKQHQIYGAIKEIENVIRMLDQVRDAELQEQDIALSREEEPKLLDRIAERFKK